MKQLKDCTPTESCTKPNILCAYPDCARGEAKNAIKKTPTIEDQSAEITRLQEQLAPAGQEQDQSIELTELEECDKAEYPELYEHLWHLAELRNDLRAMRGE